MIWLANVGPPHRVGTSAACWQSSGRPAQGLSALTVVEAFLTPESRTVTRTVALSEPRARIIPRGMGAGGYGLLATGRS